jgi:hypothetical protein
MQETHCCLYLKNKGYTDPEASVAGSNSNATGYSNTGQYPN